eukprot:g21420.t1
MSTEAKTATEAEAKEAKESEALVEVLVDAPQTLTIDTFEAQLSTRLIPEFKERDRLYLLFKREKPLNFLIEFDNMRLAGFAQQGYAHKEARFIKSASKCCLCSLIAQT